MTEKNYIFLSQQISLMHFAFDYIFFCLLKLAEYAHRV